MSTYQETVYASDCYTESPVASENGLRGATLKAKMWGKYQYDGEQENTLTHADVVLRIPDRSNAYAKKRLVSVSLYAHAKSKKNTIQGSLPTGSSANNYIADGNFIYDFRNYVETYVESEGPGAILISDVPLNSHGNFWSYGNYRTEIRIVAHAAVSGGKYSNAYYTVASEVEIETDLGANKPYVVCEYDDEKPIVRNAYPKSGFVNEKTEATFGWEFFFDYQRVKATLKQASAKIRWRPYEETEYTEILIQGDQNTYTFPANTFSTNQIQWQVVLTSDDGIEGDPSPWYTLSTVDSLSTAEIIEPKNEMRNGQEVNAFRWQHVIATGTEQKAFDLQYSADNGASWVNIADQKEQALQSHEVAAGTLLAGTVLWRVRTYNTDSQPGAWSTNAQIVVQAPPSTPALLLESNTPRPVIKWQSDGQEAFQVRIGSNESGTIFGTAKRYKATEYIPDGPVEAAVRVQNSFGLWSEWATISIQIQNRPGQLITATYYERRAEVKIMWRSERAIFYIYRDGELIGKTTEHEYTDKRAIGKHTYTVRGADDDYYDLSNTITAIASCRTAIIADVETFAWLELHCRRGAKPQLAEDESVEVAYQHYSGRKYPVAEVTEFENKTATFEYSILDRNGADAARHLLGRTVILKTPQGRLCEGLLESIAIKTDKYGTDFAFRIRATDCREAIEYDV